MRSRRTLAASIGAAALVASTACGSSVAYSPSAGSKPTLTITSPADDSTVATPITLRFTSSEAIGPTDSGKDHVHLFIDGKENYVVVTSTRTQVKDLSPGNHTIRLTLQHADHSPAGASARVTVTVTGGSGGTPGNGSTQGGYGY